MGSLSILACLTRKEVKQVIQQLQRDNEDMLAKMQSCGCDATSLDGMHTMQTAETVSNALPSTNNILPAPSAKPEIYVAPEPECPVENPHYQVRLTYLKQFSFL